MPTMAAAATASFGGLGSPNASTCKGRANYLKLKEIRPGRRRALAPPRFDLKRRLNYVKVKQENCSMILDSETKAVELPGDHGDELRLWLRLLTCTTLIEGEVRSRLRERFDVTLPRFDLMAQLDKAPEGMTLSDVSKRMMVSNGNVTGLVERLVESGHLDRRTSESDRRVQVIRLTKAGRAEFRKMAAEHESWIADIFSDLSPKDVRELMRLLAKTKASAQKAAQSRA